MNNVSLIGRLTRDPEMRYTASGTAIVNFTLAINRPFKDENGSEQADFINCVAFGKRAETIANYVKKGNRFGVTGRIQTGSYENKEGQRVYTTDVAVDSFTFLERSNQQSGNTEQFQKPQQTPFEQSGEKIDTESADLPF